MTTAYKCSSCKYTTVFISNYKKHLSTKRHVVKLETTNNKTFTCDICKKTFNNASNKARHINSCKTKTHDVNTLLSTMNNMNQQLAELKEITVNCLNATNSITTVKDNKTVNIYYIQQNFTEPYSLEECILNAKQLSESEMGKVTSSTPSVGVERLIKTVCIEDIEIEKRPFHSIDFSRNKFAVYCADNKKKKNNWMTKTGQYIANKFYPIIESEYRKKIEASNQDIANIEKELYEMRTKNARKIYKSIGSLTQIKNEITIEELNDAIDKKISNKNNMLVKYNII
jgi:hypothetical protein